MFPARYYAPRYWPARFFAKHGLTPPPPPPVELGQVRVYINGVERTDAMYYGQPANWNLMRGSRGAGQFSFIVEPTEIFSPQAGETIKAYDPSTSRVWSGFVERINIKWLGDDGWRVVTLTGVSLEQLLDTAEVDKVHYQNVTCGAAVADLLTRTGITAISLGTVDAGPLVKALEVTNVAQGLATLALYAGFVWYVDPLDEALYFHAPGARAAAWTVVSEDVLYESMDWEQSRTDFRTGQVIQLPGVALVPITAQYSGDGTSTTFVLATIPEYILTVDLNIGLTGRAVSWTPGTDTVRITPAPPIGSLVTVRYADSGVIAVTTSSPGAGEKTHRYTVTRTFTPDGALQEATAMLARYAQLPSTLVLSTDKPGIGIARKLTIALTTPITAAPILNGDWLVQELNAAIVPGLDQQEDPFGHFRYTVHLINTAATAVFQGDGATTTFLLPVVPSSVPSLRASNPLTVANWVIGTNQITASPAMAPGDSLSADYVDSANAPDVPTFVDTWNQLNNVPSEPPSIHGEDPPASSSGGTIQPFTRTFTIFDTAVGNDIAPHTPVYSDGTALRLLGVLRKAITADLTVRINKANVELITATIPLTAMVDEVFEWSLAQGSPAVLGPFFDKEVLTADILESDGSTDANGVAQFTVEWEMT